MGDFGALSYTNSSRKPGCSPILTPAGRSDRCQRHRGLNGQPTGKARGGFHRRARRPSQATGHIPPTRQAAAAGRQLLDGSSLGALPGPS